MRIGAAATRAALCAAGLAGAPAVSAQQPELEVVLELAQGPGNLTITPDGRLILSLHQAYSPPYPVAEARGRGELYPYPLGDSLMPAPADTLPPIPGDRRMPPLTTVLGIRSDTAGNLYILDNGRQGKEPSKLVVWDSRADRLVRVIDLREATDTNSWVNDLAFDYRRRQVYISDPAGGPNAALVVVDLATGRARRVLEGHSSVVPENFEFTVAGKPLRRRRPDGSVVFPRIGVDGIAVDPGQEYVYYAPLTGSRMYRIPAADLANPDLPADSLASRVERFSDKPPSDGMVFDGAGNLYLGDLANNAVGVISPQGEYRELVRDPRISWPDDFAFDPEGRLYVVATQLHLSPLFNAGVDASRPPYLVLRMRPLAPQTPGR